MKTRSAPKTNARHIKSPSLKAVVSLTEQSGVKKNISKMAQTVVSSPKKYKKTIIETIKLAQVSSQMQSDKLLSRHYMGTIIVSDLTKLTDVEGFTLALQPILKREKVQCLGQLNHEFSNKSFTVVAGLAESHISVHTWPERHTVQLDVFLCNYAHDNRQKGERIFNAIVDYFDPIEVEATSVDRL